MRRVELEMRKREKMEEEKKKAAEAETPVNNEIDM